MRHNLILFIRGGLSVGKWPKPPQKYFDYACRSLVVCEITSLLISIPNLPQGVAVLIPAHAIFNRRDAVESIVSSSQFSFPGTSASSERENSRSRSARR